jgi:hypothetical protein
MRISLRAYARHRSIFDTAVRKAINSGRIEKATDGTVDVDRIDTSWLKNTGKAQQRTSSLSTQSPKHKAVPRTGRCLSLARSERDAWTRWPSRISAQIAAKVEVDPHKMHVALESYVRQHLSELGIFQPRGD